MIDFEVVGEQTHWQGQVIRAGSETYRYEDGTENTFDKIWHPGAVGIVAFDEMSVWLVRQPREASQIHDSLEIPAGKRDRPGEQLLELAKRELIEEVGKEAGRWRELFQFFASPGFCNEFITLFAASDLSDAEGGPAPEEDEHIEIVAWPLTDLADAIRATQDAKTLVGLLWLQRELAL
jgi:ADP-ribose pyrophosphatase